MNSYMPHGSASAIPQASLSSTAVVLIVTIKASPGQEAAIREALRAMVAPSRAESGCLCYNLHESKDEPGLFIFYEQWAEQAALDAHCQTPHFTGLDAKLNGRTESLVLAFQTMLE